jgi:thiol-disulfide isomerase/thioredoxin
MVSLLPPCPKNMPAAIFGTKRSRLTIVILALISLATAPPRAHAAKTAPSIAALDSLTGGSAISQGSVVYVDFWASWCVPCRVSFPWMNELSRKYRDKGLQVITINVDRDQAAAHRFLEEMNTKLDVVYDPAGKLAKVYDLEVMPTSFVYARDGTLRLRKEGFNPKETDSVEALIAKLLEEKTTQ